MEGRRALALATDLEILAGSRRPHGVRLLPAFDQYVTGIRPREPVVPSGAMARLFSQQGWVAPVLLVDGRAAGTWSHERSGDTIRVDVESFGPLPASVRKAVAGEVERLAAFLGGSPELSFDG